MSNIAKIKRAHWEIMVRYYEDNGDVAHVEYWDTACTLGEAKALIEDWLSRPVEDDYEEVEEILEEYEDMDDYFRSMDSGN